MASIKCPNCGLYNPDSAETCDCGYSFNRQSCSPVGHVDRPSTTTVLQQSVRVVDVNMPFGSMVIFMVKWAIASIPAFIILFLIVFFISVVFGGTLIGLGSLLKYR